MTRKVADCREMPSESGCTLTIAGEEEEVVARRECPRGRGARTRGRARTSPADSIDAEGRVAPAARVVPALAPAKDRDLPGDGASETVPSRPPPGPGETGPGVGVSGPSGFHPTRRGGSGYAA